MDVSNLINPLNAPQRQAVTSDNPHLLVLAGAGSGKTRVLIHRIAWLMASEQATARQILAVTFTNKAAREMQQRITAFIDETQGQVKPWMGTFHSIAHRLLRIHWQAAKLPQHFQLLDNDEQLRCIKKVLRALHVDEKNEDIRQVQSFINKCKNEGLRAKEVIVSERDIRQQVLIQFYTAYETHCQQAGVVDFCELLLRAYELFRDNPDILQQYQRRYRYFLVDEFQDTNHLQYLWLRLWSGEEGELFVVGDDDQSIYSWRGANVGNIARLQEDYPKLEYVRLEQNYRSTQTILHAANALISHNTQRLGKQLWTEGEKGSPLFLYSAYSETDEAEFIAQRILYYQEKTQGSLDNIVLLYRTSAQSRVLEEALLQHSIPYRIYGGLRFYERAEIKDCLAYLQLLLNPDSDTAFERVINTPKRGIGDRSVEEIRRIAREQQISLWQACCRLIEYGGLAKRTINALQLFVNLINSLKKDSESLALADQIAAIQSQAKLADYYKKIHKQEAEGRLENLAELVNAAREFSLYDMVSDSTISQQEHFLAHAVLETGGEQGDSTQDRVQLMTLHLAKGLEFDTVFLCGLEEQLFPHRNSIREDNLEEERRLCYVGITRAQRELYLCHSESRFVYGQRHYTEPSRFLAEIPSELVEPIRLSTAKTFFSPSSQQVIDVVVGDQVVHPIFGEGTVIEEEGIEPRKLVQVSFAEGEKWLVLATAQLQKQTESS